VSTDEPIKQLFAKDTNDCVGIKGHKDTETCATLTDLKACGQSVTLKEAILSAITVDTCDGYSFKVFDLTERAEV
jgi:hypothetical protein